MARTIDIATHAVRRDAFMDAAERLFRTKGYADTSIQDILDATGASRGAFYHYFGSKGELLEAVVDRMVAVATTIGGPIVEDPALDAPHKLRALFETITSWKLDRSDLMHAMLEAWISDENALMREHYRRRVTSTLVPLLTRIIDQGITEGTFRATSPDGSARALVHLLIGLQDEVTRMLVGARQGTLTFDDAWQVMSSYPAAFEQVVGAPAGTFPFVDKETLRPWFD
jgi:AcrR family transcriptional regulator